MTDRQLKRFAKDFRDGILGGRPSDMMCFAVCAPLQAMLHCVGVNTEIVTSDFPEVNHVWLRLEDGRILDPTADQFGLESVYLGPLPLIYSARKARLRSIA